MNNSKRLPLRRLLAASVCAAITIASEVGAAPLQADVPAHWVPGDRTAVANLFRELDAKHRANASRLTMSVLPVTSCADDGTSGTLRSVVSGAGEGDVVDLSGLACGPINLIKGAIPVYVDVLGIRGRSAADTVISGNGADRIFVDYGYSALVLDSVTVRDGLNQVSGYHVAGGGCILSNAVVSLDHAVVTGCKAIGEGAYGGGILSPGLNMYTSTISNNVAEGSVLKTLTASYGGGAFAYRSIVALFYSTVSGNRAVSDPSNTHGSYDTGAGIFADEDGSYVLRSTISDNYTDGTGGGIATHGAISISDSTISGNTATRKSGGGIFAPRDGLVVTASTISDNAAAHGGGIYGNGSFGFGFGIVLQSSIVANNFVSSGFADVAMQTATPIFGTNSLVMDAQDDLLAPDTLRDDPQLLPLGFNGGPTQTHAISPTSPARDKGSTAGLAVMTDQRGAPYSREYGAAADIGAFEYVPPDEIFKDGFD